jgi:hypothetical protein
MKHGVSLLKPHTVGTGATAFCGSRYHQKLSAKALTVAPIKTAIASSNVRFIFATLEMTFRCARLSTASQGCEARNLQAGVGARSTRRGHYGTRLFYGRA